MQDARQEARAVDWYLSQSPTHKTYRDLARQQRKSIRHTIIKSGNTPWRPPLQQAIKKGERLGWFTQACAAVAEKWKLRQTMPARAHSSWFGPLEKLWKASVAFDIVNTASKRRPQESDYIDSLNIVERVWWERSCRGTNSPSRFLILSGEHPHVLYTSIRTSYVE
jgi:hypothetical protein